MTSKLPLVYFFNTSGVSLLGSTDINIGWNLTPEAFTSSFCSTNDREEINNLRIYEI